MWVYGSGFPKSHNLEGEWEGWGTALKPAHEPICVARKPFANSVAANVAQHGTGALHIDACRVPAPDAQSGTYDVKRLAPEASVNATGNWKQSDTRYQGTLKPGRWPANFIHDGSEEVVALFPTEAGASAPVLGTEPTANGFSGSVMYSGMIGRINSLHSYRGDSGSAARFFYCPKTCTSERNEGCDHLPDKAWENEGAAVPERARRPFKPSKNNHPTVKPIALMRWLCRLITPPGGVVLDPFMGSGSTGIAALQEGFHFIGMDKTPEWHPIAEARLQHALRQMETAKTEPDPQLFLSL
jgi:site-specific DNA-methyltransferase (adenine-specific)